MNDFSFSAVFRAAFNALVKNFTGVVMLSVLSAALVLFVSLFLNSLFLSRIESLINASLSGNLVSGAADYAKAVNPMAGFAFFIGILFLFCALTVFFTASVFLPYCKGKAMALKNYIPSFVSIVKFAFAAAVLFAVAGCIIIAMPLIAAGVSGGDGYTAGLFAVSAVSFALLAVCAVFALKYSLFFLPLLEGAGLKDALAKSRRLTKGRIMKMFILFAVLFVINFTGQIFVFFIVLTAPFSIFAVIYAYLELSGADLNVSEAKASGIENVE